ncbi:DUF3306 domain-containing protein [Phreatobacter stygius]|uniref:DUF3306 domain-containing protein n=1 Tax=Phreatobacter stygius TaxID=1940610 RepID=A0A4D7B2E2_9HYPH|nr:DUF3306 domain-containing protein [Phreatobacter stygius]QCI67909.1 DUF3306 domain-containing protein [Phreatobacter stygius]
MTGPGDDEGFLSRWSRRKRAPEPAVEAVTPGEPQTAPSAGEAAKALEDLIAELPAIQDLVAGQDLSAFMRPGVPLDLRNQALRRMWSIDPAIRDFVGEALDYAYDYNTPGAISGFGPLTAGADQVRAVLDGFDRVLAGTPGESGAPSESGAKTGQDPIASDNMSQAALAGTPAPQDLAAVQQLMAQDDLAALPESGGASGEPSAVSKTGENGQNHAPVVHAAMPEKSPENPETEPVRRRHGGALPG